MFRFFLEYNNESIDNKQKISLSLFLKGFLINIYTNFRVPVTLVYLKFILLLIGFEFFGVIPISADTNQFYILFIRKSRNERAVSNRFWKIILTLKNLRQTFRTSALHFAIFGNEVYFTHDTQAWKFILSKQVCQKWYNMPMRVVVLFVRQMYSNNTG